MVDNDIQPNKLSGTSSEKEQDEWSDSYLVDNLKQHLATIELSKSKIQTDFLDTPNDKFNSIFLFNIESTLRKSSISLFEDRNT